MVFAALFCGFVLNNECNFDGENEIIEYDPNTLLSEININLEKLKAFGIDILTHEIDGNRVFDLLSQGNFEKGMLTELFGDNFIDEESSVFHNCYESGITVRFWGPRRERLNICCSHNAKYKYDNKRNKITIIDSLSYYMKSTISFELSEYTNNAPQQTFYTESTKELFKKVRDDSEKLHNLVIDILMTKIKYKPKKNKSFLMNILSSNINEKTLFDLFRRGKLREEIPTSLFWANPFIDRYSQAVVMYASPCLYSIEFKPLDEEEYLKIIHYDELPHFRGNFIVFLKANNIFKQVEFDWPKNLKKNEPKDTEPTCYYSLCQIL